MSLTLNLHSITNHNVRRINTGRGGTGDTWAFLDKRTGQQVAIKFINRPLPKVLVQNIEREFTVRTIYTLYRFNQGTMH